MATFIEKIVDHFLDTYQGDFLDTCFVLPNRRAGLYLKKHISLKLKKTTWAPSVFAIEDFVCHITGLHVADQLTQLTELYRAYISIEKENAQSFDEFMNWAPMLISDYNDCDMNLADAVQVFKLLNEAKAISQWNLEQQPLTDYEKNYLNFYNSLSRYYPEFTSRLRKKNAAHQGLIYKTAAKEIGNYNESCPYKKIIFAGFNALTTSEEKIISELLRSGRAEILWDSDTYYSENRNHEAGLFLRKYRKEWKLKEFLWNEENFRNDPKNIFVTGVPMNIGQAEYAGQLLSEMKDEVVNSEKTAVVLADEKLLTPVLYSIPENVKDMNITMGYPLVHSSAFSLFDAIFRMFMNAEKFRSQGRLRFYYKDITEVLNHPYCIPLTSGNSAAEQMLSANRVFLFADEIIRLIGPGDLAPLFSVKEKSARELPLKLILLIDAIRKSETKNKPVVKKIETEFLFLFAGILNRMRDLAAENDFIKELKTLHALFRSMASSTTLPFVGEPLKGLQIMGMLETRTLDFENLILLSVNENILPSGKHHNTFIPFDIRNSAGLSTYRQKEAIFAYHFYRLIQRAKNIHILYNSKADDLGSGEKSRFITQLIGELPVYNKKCSIHQDVLTNNIRIDKKVLGISIPKTPGIISKLKRIAEKGFSPSALNAYVSCPLKFYFNYIEGLEETEEVAETVDAATLGTVVHHILNELHKDFIDKEVTPPDIKKMHDRISGLCDEAFNIHYPGGDIRYGKNLLISKVAQKLTANFLHAESEKISGLNASKQKLIIKKLEEEYRSPLPEIKCSGGTVKPLLRGKIDRTEVCGDTTRIIDYKTGMVSPKELKPDDLSNLASDTNLSKSLQLLCYSYVYMKNTKTHNVKTGIISLRSPSKGFMPVFITEANTDIVSNSTLEKFEKVITGIISSIFEPTTSFNQTEDLEICENCSFAAICNR